MSKEVTLSVLIETLWNVKSLGVMQRFCIPSINRNIVECKGVYLVGICASVMY